MAVSGTVVILLSNGAQRCLLVMSPLHVGASLRKTLLKSGQQTSRAPGYVHCENVVHSSLSTRCCCLD